jgi:hypothetical protein
MEGLTALHALHVGSKQMVFTKSDKTFERAASDDAERLALLRKLKRKRNIGFWGAIMGFLVTFTLGIAMVGTYSLETSDWLLKTIQFLPLFSFGLLCGSILLNQDVKMLILSGQQPCDPETRPAEHVADGKPAPVSR